MSTELIVISQLPVIEEQLKALKESWEARAAEAASMVCTEDTVQTLKAMRAEMRKEFEEADRQRKAVKARYMEPWDKVEATFKDCVKDAFTRADSALKSNIQGFEDELKKRCEADLREYFAELIAMEHIDFLSFEQAMSIGKIKISLADAKKTTPRQLQDALASVVSTVAVSVEQISQMEDTPAIMAEYKSCFDVGKAVAIVQGRKRREEAEREAAEARRTAQAEQKAAVEKVIAAAPAKAVEAPQAPVSPASEYPKAVGFTIYLDNPMQFEAIKPALKELRRILVQEGIRYE